jgi:uncharacterized protein YcfJ
VYDQFDLTTTVVVVTILVTLAICGGAVWLAFRNERLGAALLVGVAVAALLYGVLKDSSQYAPTVPAAPVTQSPR